MVENPHQIIARVYIIKWEMVRPGGFEPPTSWFVAMRSIQLIYGRTQIGPRTLPKRP